LIKSTQISSNGLKNKNKQLECQMIITLLNGINGHLKIELRLTLLMNLPLA